MTEHEFTLADRIQKIQSTIRQNGEENFCLSFSGGKDSTVLSKLLDVALPDNKIPRVFANTGIEYRAIVSFVERKREIDSRIQIINPSVPIRKMLEEQGYPFKSKSHSKWLYNYQKKGMYWAIENYLGVGEKTLFRGCPKILKYQFSEDFNIKVSDKCCENLKEKPIEKWKKENGKSISIIGVMHEEGGRRLRAKCITEKGGKVRVFQPMVFVSKEWEDWFIEKFDVELCELYNEPYNLERTGCKGCPFALHLQNELDTLQRLLPNERKQCEIIWKPIYDEYRRIGYRLRKPESLDGQMNIYEYMLDR